ncbi:hypothetical protein GOP47_0018588 [Adiantum capillus-veneris]|uniref:Trichome birefringence-like N-terminal domain-containing protein n=1 Tax=Adiantum capillus-veneris TaxID=13818 RepID=A0A9D4Z8Y0_ADICA|nr:hypothetical protein GOP47_0018588 [Adiantum capillus-veneris]
MAGGASSLVSLAIVAFLLSNCWWSLIFFPHTPELGSSTSSGRCDLSQGEWVPDIDSHPLYTNNTCQYIQRSQNCLQNGRPDRDYLHWRWKPFDCELPPFDGTHFLELMRGKKLAFIGDSLARNQMQSLHCMLRQAEEPINLYSDPHEKEYKWLFPSSNFTLANFQSRFLVNYTEPEDDIRKVYLDVPDMVWWRELAEYDIAVMSTGYWYFTESLYYVNNKVLGASKGSQLNVTKVEMWAAMGIALRNVLKQMSNEYKGIIVLRTVTVDHFKNGTWSTGGVCKRTSPFSHQNGGIPPMDWISRKINKVQIEEFDKAMAYVDDTSRLKLLNITYSAFLRPDGHPGTHRRQEPGEPVFDCLHWCLPGPIDTWNQLLLHTLQPLADHSPSSTST